MGDDAWLWFAKEAEYGCQTNDPDQLAFWDSCQIGYILDRHFCF